MELMFFENFRGFETTKLFFDEKMDVSQHLAHDMNVIRTRTVEKHGEANRSFTAFLAGAAQPGKF